MTLIEVLPKDVEGNIVLSPAGEINGVPVDGIVNIHWFETNFPDLASATVPLSDDDFASLKGIDQFWSINAERWRSKGLI